MADVTFEPTAEEVQRALERLRKQKEYRKQYMAKRRENPELAAREAERRKAYFEAHKDEIYERRKAYYEANKDKIKAYRQRYQEKQKAILAKIREQAKANGMSLEEYIESIS
jgi:hypothetical protein